MSALKVSLEILPFSESKVGVSDAGSAATEGEYTDANGSLRFCARVDVHRSRLSPTRHVGLLSVLVVSRDVIQVVLL